MNLRLWILKFSINENKNLWSRLTNICIFHFLCSLYFLFLRLTNFDFCRLKLLNSIDSTTHLFMHGLTFYSIRMLISRFVMGAASLFVGSMAFFVGHLLDHRMTLGFSHRFTNFIVFRSIGYLDFRATFLSGCKGQIFSEKYWYYFQCPKNVLCSILRFVFWIFPQFQNLFFRIVFVTFFVQWEKCFILSEK